MTDVPPPPVVSPERVRRLALDVARRLDGILQGDHLGYLPGPGSEPAEARVYSPGDDVRRMDWAVTARSTMPHVRTTIAERELETTIVVDLSASMSFGTATAEKRDVALALAAAFLHLTHGAGDRTAAILVDAHGVRTMPARTGSVGAAVTLTALMRATRADGPGAGLAEGLAAIRLRRRGLVVAVTDLLEPAERWQRSLRMLASRNEVLVAQVIDRRELALPDVGVLRLVDPESGREVEVRTTRSVRERYAAAAAARLEQQRAAVRAAGAGHLVVHTETDWLPQLARFLSIRRRTRAAVRVGR